MHASRTSAEVRSLSQQGCYTNVMIVFCFRYNVSCSNLPTLRNGMPNCEKSLHALQAAFGAMCVQNVIGPQHNVISCVVVACTDGAKLYWPPKALANPIHFGSPSTATTVKKVKNHLRDTSKLLRIPGRDTAAYRKLQAAVKSTFGCDVCQQQTTSIQLGVFKLTGLLHSKHVAVGVVSSKIGAAQRAKAISRVCQLSTQEIKSPCIIIPCIAVIEKGKIVVSQAHAPIKR